MRKLLSEFNHYYSSMVNYIQILADQHFKGLFVQQLFHSIEPDVIVSLNDMQICITYTHMPHKYNIYSTKFKCMSVIRIN